MFRDDILQRNFVATFCSGRARLSAIFENSGRMRCPTAGCEQALHPVQATVRNGVIESLSLQEDCRKALVFPVIRFSLCRCTTVETGYSGHEVLGGREQGCNSTEERDMGGWVDLRCVSD